MFRYRIAEIPRKTKKEPGPFDLGYALAAIWLTNDPALQDGATRGVLRSVETEGGLFDSLLSHDMNNESDKLPIINRQFL